MREGKAVWERRLVEELLSALSKALGFDPELEQLEKGSGLGQWLGTFWIAGRKEGISLVTKLCGFDLLSTPFSHLAFDSY